MVMGAAASLRRDRHVLAGSSAYSVAGTAATLVAGPVKQVVADSGSYAHAGVATSILIGRQLTAGVASYIVIGTDAALQLGIVTVEEPAEIGHSAGISVAYRRRWHEYIHGRKRRGVWRPGEGTLEEILRGVYEAEEAVQPERFDLEAARKALEASRAAARELEATRQREAILEALLASQRALEDRMAGMASDLAARQQARFEAVQEAVMAAALEWERREQDDLEVLLLLCA